MPGTQSHGQEDAAGTRVRSPELFSAGQGPAAPRTGKELNSFTGVTVTCAEAPACGGLAVRGPGGLELRNTGQPAPSGSHQLSSTRGWQHPGGRPQSRHRLLGSTLNTCPNYASPFWEEGGSQDRCDDENQKIHAERRGREEPLAPSEEKRQIRIQGLVKRRVFMQMQVRYCCSFNKWHGKHVTLSALRQVHAGVQRAGETRPVLGEQSLMRLNNNVLSEAGEWRRQQKPQHHALRRVRGRRVAETVLEVGAGPGPEGPRGFGRREHLRGHPGPRGSKATQPAAAAAESTGSLSVTDAQAHPTCSVRICA